MLSPSTTRQLTARDAFIILWADALYCTVHDNSRAFCGLPLYKVLKSRSSLGRPLGESLALARKTIPGLAYTFYTQLKTTGEVQTLFRQEYIKWLRS